MKRNGAVIIAFVLAAAAVIGYFEREKSQRREYETAKEVFVITVRTHDMVLARRFNPATPAELAEMQKQYSDAYLRLHRAADTAGLPGPEAVRAMLPHTLSGN